MFQRLVGTATAFKDKTRAKVINVLRSQGIKKPPVNPVELDRLDSVGRGMESLLRSPGGINLMEHLKERRNTMFELWDAGEKAREYQIRADELRLVIEYVEDMVSAGNVAREQISNLG